MTSVTLDRPRERWEDLVEPAVQVCRPPLHEPSDPMSAFARLTQHLLLSHCRIPAVSDVLCIRLAPVVFVDVAPVEHQFGDRGIGGTEPGEDVDVERAPEFLMNRLEVVEPHLFDAVDPCRSHRYEARQLLSVLRGE